MDNEGNRVRTRNGTNKRMKLRGGCLSREDLQQVLKTLQNDNVPTWQKQKLISVLKSRRNEPVEGNEASSIRAAILDRRIQELAWLKPIPIEEGQADLPRQLVAEQFPSRGGGPLLAHCFNSHIVHNPEEFQFGRPNKNSPYQCSTITGEEAKILCSKKVRNSALFRSIDDKEKISIEEDVNSGKFNKVFNYYLQEVEQQQRRTPLVPLVTSPMVVSSTPSSVLPLSPISMSSNVSTTSNVVNFLTSPSNSLNTVFKPVSQKNTVGKNMNASGL